MIPNITRTVPDASRKGCSDCRCLVAAVNWWCSNEEAIRDRRTRIPGIIHCPHWQPAQVKRFSLFSWLLGEKEVG